MNLQFSYKSLKEGVTMKEVFQFKDSEKTKIIVDDDYIHFKRKGMFNRKGEYSVPLEAVTKVLFKKPGFFAGYMQFVTGSEKVKAHKVINDENYVTFSEKELSKALELKGVVEVYIAKNTSNQTSTSNIGVASELQQLAELKEKES